jgi:hypothetical protein
MRLFYGLIAALVVLFSAAPSFAQAIGYAETKGLIAGQTLMFYDSHFGTQVEYNAPNGSTYLLFPGNEVVLKGSWKLTKTDNPNVFNMCFKYPASSHNPVTKQSGGKWECQAAGFYLGGSAEIREGDVLGLSRQTEVPFVLAKRKTTLAALIRKAGG